MPIQDDLFESAARQHKRRGVLRRLGAIVAPVAADSGALIDDDVYFQAAKAIADAFHDGDSGGGLTRNQICARIGRAIDQPVLDNRFDVLLKLEMLQPILDKRNQQRYVLNPAGVAGLLMFERAGKRGGIDEVLMLLSRTKEDIEHQLLKVEQVAVRIAQIRHLLAVFTDNLLRLLTTATLSELVEERSQHSEQVLDDAQQLNEIVTQRFPELDPAAARLLDEALRYFRSLQDLIARILDEGAKTHDFALLPPEDYIAAAIEASSHQLADVFAEVVFDPPMPWVDSSAVISAIEEYAPRSRIRVRPPEMDSISGEDPLERLARLDEQRTAEQRSRAEVVLAGKPRADVTPLSRGVRWRSAALELGQLFGIDANPALPFRLRLEDWLIIDPTGDITYVTPAELVDSAVAPPELEVLVGGVNVSA